jgi:hypothetical protein
MEHPSLTRGCWPASVARGRRLSVSWSRGGLAGSAAVTDGSRVLRAGPAYRDLPGVPDPARTLELPIGRATDHRLTKLPDVDTHGHTQTLLSAGDLLPVHLVDARGTVCFATHGDDLLQVPLRDLNSFALAAYRGIPTSISITTTLRSAGYPRPTQDSRPAAGQALPGRIR